MSKVQITAADFKRHHFAAQAALIEAERCAADLMYSILTHPKQPLLHEILTHCFDLIEKKNAPDLLQSRMYREGKEFILSEKADHFIRLFYLLFFLSKEQEVQELFIQGCLAKHAGNLFKDGAVEHLQLYFVMLQEMADKTLNFNCNIVNMTTVARTMVCEAKKAYVLS